MGRAATATAATALTAALLLAGCGSSEETTSAPQPVGGASGAPIGASVKTCHPSGKGLKPAKVAGLPCKQANAVVVAWNGRLKECAPAPGASRSSCTVRGYRCLSLRAPGNYLVSCSRPGRSIFFARRA